jgi:predicted TIM-barrel fold metal-dependent hydrolase
MAMTDTAPAIVETLGYRPFDADNHYYEALDAFSRHLDPRHATRVFQWAQIEGRTYPVLGGKVFRGVKNATFDPVAFPGVLADYFRGNPNGDDPLELLSRHEPIRPEYRDRDARLQTMDDQGIGAAWIFPTLGMIYEEPLRHDPEAVTLLFTAFNRWLEEDWGFAYQQRIFAVPYVQLLDPVAAADELRSLVERGAVVVNVRNAPVPAPGGYRSPFDPAYDPFWGLAAESGVIVATHAGNDGYDALIKMWEPGGAESSIFRSPLRNVVTKNRAVSDFYATAVCHKVFERFPALRLASVENGASWIPDLLHRLDDAANRNPGYFAEHPSDTFGEHVWVTPFWEDDVPGLVDELRTDRLLLGSDWPHAEGTRRPLDFVTDTLAGLPDEDVQRIARANAAELLGVPLPA